ncbi:hypothetical protein GJ496_006278 [Pomphorhynchus laevis]|nr:hypothetical protein GJ496_006278 [Pomphorhynchus laevis]
MNLDKDNFLFLVKAVSIMCIRRSHAISSPTVNYDKGQYHVQALFDYVPLDYHKQNDLNFTKSTIIKILGTAGPQWLYGQLGNKCGMLPANYVRRFDFK